MKTIFHPRRQRASTMTDVLIVVVTLLLLALVFLPYFARPTNRGGSKRLGCISNQKQTALAFILWAWDNEGQFPFTTTTIGGTAQFADSTNVFLHFRALSNELSAPKLLVCPSDRSDPARSLGFDFDTLTNQNLSYFIGLTADPNDFQSILIGDRNLTTNGTALAAGVFSLAPSNQLGWAQTIHKSQGNIALADGSVQQSSAANFQTQWQASTNAARRLAIP